MFQDLRHSLRLLRRSPVFTAVAVLVLALGIGANTAVFSLVNTLVLQPRQGRIDQLVAVFDRDRDKPSEYQNFSYATYRDLRDRSGIFDALMAHSFTTVGVRDGDLTRQAFATLVSSNYFTTLGVGLGAGRPFTADEERPGSDARVAIASYALWRRRGFDRGFIGSHVTINGADFAVVGVTPAGFGGPFAFVSPQWWLPLGAYDTITNPLFKDRSTSLADRRNHALNLAGVLSPGTTASVAAQRLDAFAKALGAENPDTDRSRTFLTSRLPRMTISSRPQDDGPLTMVGALLSLMAALVLVVACLNLANLLLARSAARRREFAIRQALGGGRARIVRQLLIEGLTLASMGAAVALVASWWTASALAASLASIMTFGVDFIVTPSPRTAIAAIGFAVLSTVVFALGPAWSVSRLEVTNDLKLAPRDGRHRMRTASILAVGQLALSLALVAAGGLFARGAVEAMRIDVGYPVARQIAVSVDPSLAGYDETRTRSVYRTLLARLRALPGVEQASFASTIAFGDVQIDGRVSTSATGDFVQAMSDVIGADYFKTLDAPLVRGREFSAAEESDASGEPPAIIDVQLARKLFGDEDPIGRPVLLRQRAADPPKRFQVVGIAPSLRQDIFETGAKPHIYVAYGDRFTTSMVLHVRTHSGISETSMLDLVNRDLRTFDASLPVVWARTLTMHREKSASMWIVRAAAGLFSAFGLLALVIAAVGVYGLKAYEVSGRTREFGIRMALGASERSVAALVLGEGVRLTAVSLGLGLLIALGIGKLLSNLIYAVSPFDPVVLTIAAATLATAAMLACYVPARRATRIAPLDALRTD
ncbi:MAG TPA: ADOP family duplicated permease [Vicinamibacterales bacterium]|jgi:predicted permease